ncbi:ATP-binding cassette domain-containing protein [bacterium]|nr:ATP-binding cassette domain-containing protein [bacterium]
MIGGGGSGGGGGRGLGERSSRAGASVSWSEVIATCASYWLRWPRVFGFFVAAIALAVVAETLAPVAIGVMVGEASRVTPGGGPNAAMVWLGVSAGALLAQAGLRFLADRAWNTLDVRCMHAIQLDMYGRVQRFSADWHSNTFAGATVHKISRARWALDTIGTILLVRLAPAIVMLLVFAGLFLARAPAAGAAFLMLAVLYLAASISLSVSWVRPANIDAADADSSLTGQVADGVSNNAAVRAFGAEDREDQRLSVVADRWATLATRSFNRGVAMNALQLAFWVVLQTVTVGLILLAASRGEAGPGDVAFAIAANLQLGGQLRGIGGDIRMLQRGFSEFADAIHFLKSPYAVPDPKHPKPFRGDRGEIVFDHITFSYDRRSPLYDDFSLVIAPGERIGLVGPSGSGKSTFVKLIQRLYDVDAGEIRIDGLPIVAAAQSELRRSIAIVPQDPALFHRSLAENIAYGRPDASLDEIRAAARRARAADFIEKLPQGYDTLVGERGLKLSGGERQRVALARAFLADAPILILDEATSSLDTLTERDIQAAIGELMWQRTTIVIAHRLSTVRGVDRILVFDDGRIIEQGSHAQLMALPSGLYRGLHDVQLAVAHGDEKRLGAAE